MMCITKWIRHWQRCSKLVLKPCGIALRIKWRCLSSPNAGSQPPASAPKVCFSSRWRKRQTVVSSGGAATPTRLPPIPLKAPLGRKRPLLHRHVPPPIRLINQAVDAELVRRFPKVTHTFTRTFQKNQTYSDPSPDEIVRFDTAVRAAVRRAIQKSCSCYRIGRNSDFRITNFVTRMGAAADAK
jgi:hypothetical protein